MQILGLEFENWNTVLLRVNWLTVIIAIVILFIISFAFQKTKKHMGKKSITIDEVCLGIGDSSIKLTYNAKDREIAYKLWVELSTRKIGLPFDKENDVIVEVYNSWYEFFKIARELLKEIPIDRLPYSNELIKLTENILNKGLRPHLTKWQARYRKWYENAATTKNTDYPQELQKSFPYYEQLIDDLVETNKHMIEYKELMRKVAFEEIK